jgi:rfaE bifunctional protein kinase chain/domain
MSPAQILACLPKLSALVVGDICLDRWCTYDPGVWEPSRETGIPRIGVVRTQTTPGAGGTVANNLAALGVGRVAVLGVAGDDGFGWELARALEARGIDSSLCLRAAGLQTFTYTKVINAVTGVEDRPRLDFINTVPLDAAVERRLLDVLREAAGPFDIIAIADQAETSQGGVITPAVRDAAADLARRHPEKVVLADSRARIELFRDVIVKPNQQEADVACRALFGAKDYAALRRHTRAPLLLVTHGRDGVAVISPVGESWAPTRPVENPVDICGAGDSFTAGFTSALATGAPPVEAARFGSLVASVTIMKPGTGTASPEEVTAAAAGADA